MAKSTPAPTPAVTPAPLAVPLGTTFAASTAKNISAPADLCGRKVALNLAASCWLELPISHTMINEENPVFDIPSKDAISEDDLKALFGLLRKRMIILGEIPVPKFVKNQERLQFHLDHYAKNINFEIVRRHILSVVNGPYMDGGYNKIEILESILALEKGETKGKGGLRRAQVIKTLNDAIVHVQRVWGGVSPVASEREEGKMIPSSSGRNMAERTLKPGDHRKFLESDL